MSPVSRWRISQPLLRAVRYTRGWAVLTGVVLATAVLAVVLLAPAGYPGPAGLRSLVRAAPPRSSFQGPAPRDTAPTLDAFAGAAACAQCHAAQVAAWRASTHARAGAAPAGDAVIAPFDGQPIRFRDAVVIPSRRADGAPQFTVRQEGRPPLTLPVAAVVGGGHLVGGGTQIFFTPAADGTLRFPPFDWSRTADTWFCSTNGRTDRGWLPITPELALGECGDWPPTRVLGDHQRQESCQQCHGSQITAAWDASQHRTETRFATLAIDCEACHGPARRHVEQARAGELGADVGLPVLASFGKDASLGVCFNCHALKERPGRGQPFALGLPLLAARPHFPDGRIRLFGYQEQHRWSACYRDGGMTCTSCHDPHRQSYRDVNGTPLVGRLDDRQCTSCHQSKAEAPERHTRHARGSAGSRCVACHMPYLQEPSTGTRIPYARSDHTIPVPRPAFDAALGIRSACAGCHAGRAPAELERQARAWWGEPAPHPDLVAGLLRADSATDRLAEARLLLADSAGSARHVVGQVQALGHFFLHRLGPDMPDLEPEIVERLRRLAAHDDPDIRAIALASLHLASGRDRHTWRDLAAARRTAPDAVSARWAWILMFRADAYLSQHEPRLALAAARKAWEVRPDDPTTLRALAAAYGNTGDWRTAVTLFRTSLARDSTASDTWAGLAFALVQRGDWDGAQAAYAKASAVDPWDPAPHLSLGNAYARRGDVAGAVREWQQALALDPSRADAEFGLASAYASQGRRDAALLAVQRGLQYQPENPTGRELLRRLTP